MQFKKGNKKLGREIAIFDLPRRLTCPGATAWCMKYCYAQKAERVYKAVLPFRFRNLAATKLKSFVKEAIAQLKRMRTTKYVRIHSSGDFYSQAYVNKWTQIIKANPNIRFTFYTKSFHLYDFRAMRKLPNVNAFASIDLTTPKERLRKASGWKKAYIICGEVPADTFVCPGSCKSCSHCYNKETGNVGFKPH